MKHEIKTMQFIYQVFQRKTLVIKMMKVGGAGVAVGGWAGRRQQFVSRATVKNILMILARIVKQVSAECRIQE